MEDLRKKLVFILSGVIALIIVIIFMYLINDIRFECKTEDNSSFIATEIKTEGEICWGKMEDGTYKKINEYKEVSHFNLFTYIFIALFLYVAVTFVFYNIIINY